MKVKDIAKDNGINVREFENWLILSGRTYKSGLTGISVDDTVDVDELVRAYNEHNSKFQARISEEREKNESIRAQETLAEQARQREMASMLITSGFNFDGYSITKYSGYISGDAAVSMDRPTHGWLGGVNGEVGGDLLAGLGHIRRSALAELKEAALALGCNAVIGVDFDYLTLDPETATNQGGTLYLPFLFAVTANGNAVVIEKKE